MSEAGASVVCPTCNGAGKAWQWRNYGDRQYHGEYFERCDFCGGTGTVDPPKPDAP